MQWWLWVDSGLATGMTVTSSYDPMLAKIIAWGPDRGSAFSWRGELGVHGRARACGAVNGDGAAERLDAVLEPDQPRSPVRIGPAASYVIDPDLKGTLGGLRLDLDDRGSCVPGRIGQRLGDHVVGGHLDPFR
jgi:hypothetical protein